MKKAVIAVTDGFEEMEAIVPADIMDRADIKVTIASITGKTEVKGCHGITLIAGCLFDADTAFNADMLVLPGGPGAASYIGCKELTDTLVRRDREGKFIAAICAAPVTLGKLGLLGDKTATCFPGKASELIAKNRLDRNVVIDKNIITGLAAGSAVDFGLALVTCLAGEEATEKVKTAICIA